MIQSKHSIVIHRPTHEVFKYLQDHENRLYWQPNLVTHEHERLEKGARIKEVRNVLGRRIEIEGEITEFEADKRLTFKGKGPHVKRLEYHYTLKPEGNSTRLETQIDVELPDLFGLARPVIQRMTDRELDNAHQLLKDVLEHEHLQHDLAKKLPPHERLSKDPPPTR